MRGGWTALQMSSWPGDYVADRTDDYADDYAAALTVQSLVEQCGVCCDDC